LARLNRLQEKPEQQLARGLKPAGMTEMNGVDAALKRRSTNG
jgi:hypothetical protein